MGDDNILLLGLVSKKGLSLLLFLRHVSHLGYSLSFHFLEDFRQVRDRRYLDPMGTDFGGGQCGISEVDGIGAGIGDLGIGSLR